MTVTNLNSSMINPTVSDLLEKVDSKYSLVIITSRRARQIIDGAKPLITTDIIKPLSIAVNEINQGAVTFVKIKEEIK